MRLAMAAMVALSLAACSKTNKAADAAATDAAAAPATATDAAAAPAAGADASATAPAADPSAGPNAPVKDAHPVNAGAPAGGANSFTEGQARGHIQNSGFSNVTGLTQDSNGLWHGTAMKGGKSYSVSLDYKGNVTTN